MITITLNKIKKHSPCTSGWKTLIKSKPYDAPFPVSDIIESNGIDDTLWVMRCLPEHNNLWRKYAVWCASQVRHLMADQRSICAIDVAWRHSNGQATDAELAAARDAARAAARDAAWAAAWDAAGAAAGAAAWVAARDAARDATRDATRDAQESKLRQILDAGEWVE